MRQRKDKSWKMNMLGVMDNLLLHSELTVAETLQKDMSLADVFIRNQTNCVGCYLARFCTLRDVTNAYGIKLNLFLDELQQTITPIPVQFSKEHNNENETMV